MFRIISKPQVAWIRPNIQMTVFEAIVDTEVGARGIQSELARKGVEVAMIQRLDEDTPAQKGKWILQ
jgi:hypothetical protein